MKYRALSFIPTIVVLLLVISLGLGVRDRVSDRIVARYVSAIERLETEHGLSIRYNSITVHSFSVVQIDDISISWQGSTVSIPDLSVRINPFRIQARNPLGLLRTITAHQIDAQINSETIALSRGQSVNLQNIEQFLQPLDGIKLVVKNSTVVLNTETGQYATERIDLSVTLADMALAYEGDILLSSHPVIEEPIPFLARESNGYMRIAFDGVYDIEDISNSTFVQLSDIHIAGVAMHPLSFNVQYRQRQLSVTNEEQLRNLRLVSTFDFDTDLIRFNVVSSGIEYGQLVIEQESEIDIPALLQGQYVFDLEVVYNLATKSIEYGVKFEVMKERSRIFQLDATGDNSQIVVSESTFYSSSGEAQLAGAFDLDRQTMIGELTFDQFTVGNSQPINGVFRITDIGEGLTSIIGNDFGIGQATVPQLTIDLQLAPSILNVNLSIIFDQQKTQVASVVMSNNRNTSVTDIALSLLQVSVGQLIDLGGGILFQDIPVVPAGLAELDVNARVELMIAANEIGIVSPFFNVTERATANEVFSFRASGTQDYVRLDPIMFKTFDRQFNGSATLKQIAKQVYDFDLLLAGVTQTYSLHARYRQGQFIRFTGTHGLAGVVLFLPQDQIRYNMQLASLPLQISQSEFVLSLTSRGEFKSLNQWNVAIPTVSVKESQNSLDRRRNLLGRRTVPYRLSSSIVATPQRISINQFSFRDHISAFEGDGEFVVKGDGMEIDFGIQSDTLSETVSLNGYIPFSNDDELLLTAIMERIDVRHAPQTAVTGAINSTVSIMRDEVGIIGNLTVASENTKLGNLPLQFSSSGVFHDTAVTIENLDVSYYGYRLQNGSLKYDIADDTISAVGDLLQEERLSIILATPSVIVDSPYPAISSRIEATVSLAGDSAVDSSRLEQMEIKMIPTDDFDTLPVVLTVERDYAKNRYTILGGYNDEITGYIDDDNDFQLFATREFPISFSAYGSVATGLVDVLVNDVFIDVQNIPRLADLGFMRFTSGDVHGSMRIVDDGEGVEFYGLVKSTQLSMVTTYVSEEVGPVDTFLILQKDELRLTEAYAPTGEGKGAYIDVSLQLTNGVLSSFLINIRTPDDSVVPFAYDFGVVVVDLDASGTVVLSGAPGILNVEGVVRGESGRLIARDSSKAIPKSELAPILSLDLSLSSGPQFEMLWPASDFPIIRAFPELGSTISLNTDSTGAILAEGTVDFRGGEVFYFDRSFVIREGALAMRFINGKLDPIIDLRAEIREYVTRGPVSIFLIIEDDFLSQINPRLEATPALSQAEIASILGGNIVSVSSSTTTATDPLENARIAIDLAGDVISRVAVLNDFERSLREILGIFDILTIRTQLLQNVVYDILDTSNANSTQSIARYFNNTAIFLGTYLAERLFFQLELGLRVDTQTEYLGGALDELRFNTALSFEFQSPLGVLRWNLEPQFQNAFRIDGTVGLLWNFGY